MLGLAFAVIVHVLMDRLPSPSVFHIGLPGVIAHLLITGGHGGTIFEERIGTILEIVVNTTFYTVLLWALLALVNNLRGPKPDCHP